MNGTIPSFICNPCIIPPEHPAGNGKKGTAECASSSSTTSSSSSSSSSEARCGGLLGVCAGVCKNGNQCLPDDENKCSCCPSGQIEQSDGTCGCAFGNAFVIPTSGWRGFFASIIQLFTGPLDTKSFVGSLLAEVANTDLPCNEECKDPQAKMIPGKGCRCPAGNIISVDGKCSNSCGEITNKEGNVIKKGEAFQCGGICEEGNTCTLFGDNGNESCGCKENICLRCECDNGPGITKQPQGSTDPNDATCECPNGGKFVKTERFVPNGGCCGQNPPSDKALKVGYGEKCGELLCMDCTRAACNAGYFTSCKDCNIENNCEPQKKACDDCKKRQEKDPNVKCTGIGSVCLKYAECQAEVPNGCEDNEGNKVDSLNCNNGVCGRPRQGGVDGGDGQGNGPDQPGGTPDDNGQGNENDGGGPGGGGDVAGPGDGGNGAGTEGDAAGADDGGNNGDDGGTGGNTGIPVPNPCRRVGGPPAGGPLRCAGDCSPKTGSWNPETGWEYISGECASADPGNNYCYCKYPEKETSSSSVPSNPSYCSEHLVSGGSGNPGLRTCGGTCPEGKECQMNNNACGCFSTARSSSSTPRRTVGTGGTGDDPPIPCQEAGQFEGEQCGGDCVDGKVCGRAYGTGKGPYGACECVSPITPNSSSSRGSGCQLTTYANGAQSCGGFDCGAGRVCGFTNGVCGCKEISSRSSGPSSCGWNGQQCGGTCASGTSCKLDSSGSSPNCVCAAPSESCGFNGSQCGGTCEGNATCRQIDAGCQCVVNPEQRCNPINNICGGSCPANQVCAQVTREVSLSQCTVETAGAECTTSHGERGVCGFVAGNYLTFECTRQDTRCRPYHEIGDFCTDNDEDGTCQRLQHSTELVCVKNKQLTSEEIQNRPFDRPFCGCIPAGGSSGVGTAGTAGIAGTIGGGGSTAQVAGGPAGQTGNSGGGSGGTSSTRSTSSSSGGSSGTSSQSSRGTSSSSSGGGSSQSSRSSSSSSSGGSSQSSRSTASSSSSGGSSQSSRSTSASSSLSSSSSGGSSRSSSSKSSSSSSSSSGGSTSGSIGNSRCGDGVKQPGEQCDDGVQNRDIANNCRTNCTNARCGDKIVDAGEQCDDGNSINTDFCTTSCKLTIVSGGTCGDGILQPSRGEQCDMGSLNSFLPNQCRPTCTLAVCGDGTKDTNEQCDDGNLTQRDGCSNFCLLERKIPSSSAHPAPTTGGSGIATGGQTAGYIAGQDAGQTVGAHATQGATVGQNATAGSVTGYSAGEIAGGQPSGQNGGYSAGGISGYTAGGIAGGYTAGQIGGYTAGGTASGNPWGGTILPASIPPATQTQTGPGLVILIATGAAAGIGYVRRRR